MWLYRHHTRGDLIDLDPDTLAWRPVEAHEKPAGSLLHELPVAGSYTVEDGRHYFAFWTDDGRYVFADDAGLRLPICQREPDGGLRLLAPGLTIRIDPFARLGNPPTLGRAVFEDGRGQCLAIVVYDAVWYMRAHGMDFTAATTLETVADWDFFVALQEQVEEFERTAAAPR